jgi:hypothetical protein
MKGMKFADVLSGSLAAGPKDSRSVHVGTLRDVLKLSEAEAERVATAICSLAHGEYDEDEDDEEMGSEKPPSISIVFGKRKE